MGGSRLNWATSSAVASSWRSHRRSTRSWVMWRPRCASAWCPHTSSSSPMTTPEPSACCAVSATSTNRWATEAMLPRAAELAEAIYCQGRVDEAMDWALRSRDLSATDDAHAHLLWRPVLAKTLARSGQTAEAEALAREALRLAGATDWLNAQAKIRLDLSEILVHLGQAGEAGTLCGGGQRTVRPKGRHVRPEPGARVAPCQRARIVQPQCTEAIRPPCTVLGGRTSGPSGHCSASAISGNAAASTDRRDHHRCHDERAACVRDPAHVSLLFRSCCARRARSEDRGKRRPHGSPMVRLAPCE